VAEFELLDRVPIGIFVLARDYRVRFWNRCMADWTHRSKDEVEGHDIRDFFPRLGEERYRVRLELLMEGGPPLIFSYQLHGNLFPSSRQQDAPKVRHCTVTSLTDRGGALFAVEDLTEASFRMHESRAEVSRRRKVEAELRAALAEKEMLIREVHHRVKNNLRMISSLMSLEASDLPEGRARDAILDLEARVDSISLLHEMLHRPGGIGGVRIDEYLESFASTLFRASLPQDTAATLEFELEPLSLDVDDTLRVGLLVAELLTNAIKHGIGSRGRGRILVSAKRDAGGSLVVAVSDDGPGFRGQEPPFELSFGMKLIRLLAEDLGSVLKIEELGGASFSVAIPGGRIGT
jgi:two-component sensor histidine kinase